MPPIKPCEITKDIPEIVFECFNKLINLNFSGNKSIVKLDDVIDLLTNNGINRNDIFNKHYLDIEQHYEESGWKVEYEKPEPGDHFGSFFRFTIKNGNGNEN